MGSTGSADAGQIIVVAALLLAVVIVALALVLNSAIYAENLATREETTTGDSMTVDSVTAERLGDAIDDENYGTEEDSYANRRGRLADNVSSWSELLGGRETRTGNAYSVELTGMTKGTRVNQSNPNRDFRPAKSDLLEVDPLDLGGDANWKIAEDSETRAFEMRVRRDSLTQADPGLASEVQNILDTVLSGTDRFWTEFQGETTHRMYLLNDSKNNSVAVVVTEYDYDDDSEQEVRICSIEAPHSSDNVTIRFDEAEVEGPNGASDCEALKAVHGGKQDLYYAGSDHVEGTYQFIADREEQKFRSSLASTYGNLFSALTDPLLSDPSQSDIYADTPTDQDPYTTKSVYGITVETTYSDGRLAYARNVTYPPTAR